MAMQRVVVVIPRVTESHVAEVYVSDPDIKVEVLARSMDDERRMMDKPKGQHTLPLTDRAIEESRDRWTGGLQ